MESHPIENLLKSTMENLKDMIDVNTIVGDAVESKDGSFIIPISRVSLGFVSGGSEFNSKNEEASNSDYPFGGGSGAGVTVKPVAFLVTKGDSIRLLSLNQNSTYDRIVDSIPQVMDLVKGMVNFRSEKSDNICKKQGRERKGEKEKENVEEEGEEKEKGSSSSRDSEI
ncbi:GerW family sporulation protein [Clostridium sp. WILCCON 0269]|uniref:GerW family sporulation protein n=1 Tax=Candidatus Clostridium eludens TaxID=3381663 RepID=A0ABW8SMV2_9CLOT